MAVCFKLVHSITVGKQKLDMNQTTGKNNYICHTVCYCTSMHYEFSELLRQRSKFTSHTLTAENLLLEHPCLASSQDIAFELYRSHLMTIGCLRLNVSIIMMYCIYIYSACLILAALLCTKFSRESFWVRPCPNVFLTRELPQYCSCGSSVIQWQWR